MAHAINNALGQLQAACAVMRPVLDSEDASLDHSATAAVTTITERAMAMLEAARPCLGRLQEDQQKRDGEAGSVRAVA